MRSFGLARVDDNHLANDQYEVIFTGTEYEAVAIVKSSDVQFVISDWFLAGSDNGPNKLAETVKARGVMSFGVYSGAAGMAQLAKRRYRDLDVIDCNNLYEAGAHIKTLREYQLKEFDTGLSQYMQKETPPLTVLIIDNDEEAGASMLNYLKEAMPSDHYQFIVAPDDEK
jgi:hypothetical protein